MGLRLEDKKPQTIDYPNVGDVKDHIYLESQLDQESGGRQTWVLDQKSGRLLALTYQKEKTELFRIWSTLSNEQEDQDSHQSAPLKMVETVDSSHPIWSCVQFALTQFLPVEYWFSASQKQRDFTEGAQVLYSLIGEIVDYFSSSSNPVTHEFFSLPINTSTSQDLVAQLSALINRYFELFFEPGSWPWTLLHQASLVFTQNTSTLQAELIRVLESNRMGAMGHLLYAYSLNLIGLKGARFFAKHGLEHTSEAQILSDFSSLYRGSTSLAQVGRVFFKQLRTRPKKDIDTLIKLVPTSIQAPLRKALIVLKDPQHDSLTTAIDSMILVLIKAGLRTELIKRLNQLALKAP